MLSSVFERNTHGLYGNQFVLRLCSERGVLNELLRTAGACGPHRMRIISSPRIAEKTG